MGDSIYKPGLKRDWRKCPICGTSVLRKDMVRRRVKVGQFALVRAICEWCSFKLHNPQGVTNAKN